jgi:hypothetical protein
MSAPQGALPLCFFVVVRASRPRPRALRCLPCGAGVPPAPSSASLPSLWCGLPARAPERFAAFLVVRASSPRPRALRCLPCGAGVQPAPTSALAAAALSSRRGLPSCSRRHLRAPGTGACPRHRGLPPARGRLALLAVGPAGHRNQEPPQRRHAPPRHCRECPSGEPVIGSIVWPFTDGGGGSG